jgi:hypothetical protein
MRPFISAEQATLFGTGSAPRQAKPRAADPLWDALVFVCKMQTSGMTASSRGMTNRALKELREAGATPAEVLERSRSYVERYRHTPTPMALARQWPTLAVRPRAVLRAQPQVFEPASVESRQELAQRMRAWMEERRG